MTLPGGGCVKASPFGSPSTDGVNCHNIPNVDDVSCEDSKCFVHTCKSGFTVSVRNDECIANPNAKSTRALPVPGTGHVTDAATVPGSAVDPKLSGTNALGSAAGEKVPELP